MIGTLETIVGKDHVLTGSDIARWQNDWMDMYRSEPVAVVRPASTAEVSAIVKFGNDTQTPIVPVSGNTGLAGGASGKGHIMISMERMNTIHEVRKDSRIAIVDAGVILADIHSAADAEDLVFPLTFGARGSAMIGGNMATNAGGSNVVRYGNTRDLVLGIEVVLPTGEIADLMSELRKDNSGYNLKHLIIGAEGTLGIITKAVLKLAPKPKAYATAMVAAPSIGDSLQLLNQLQDATGGSVEAFEYMPRAYVARHLEIDTSAREPFDAPYEVNIMVEIGTTIESKAQPNQDGQIPLTAELEEILAGLFESGAVLDATVAQNEAQRSALPSIDPGAIPMIVSHLGDGNVHYSVWGKSQDPEVHDAITEAVEDETLKLGGSFSAEHGIGVSKLNSMKRRKDAVSIAAMKAIKTALDPNNIMNPGKVLPD